MMWGCGTIISFISSVLAQLSIEDVQECVKEPFRREGDKSVFVHPGGPLNLLRGYIYYKDGLVRNKRLFSPAIGISYTLAYENGEYIFDSNNNNDTINSGFNGDESGWEYIKGYHEVLGIMYQVIDGQIRTATARNLSLDTFLCRHLTNPEDSRRLLASLVLLAEGVDVPLEYVDAGSEGKEALVCGSGGEDPLFRVDMFRTGGIFTEAKTVVDFFRNTGGVNLAETNSLNLSPVDEPRFLIQAYVFDFLKDCKEAKMFFGAVEDVLKYALGGDERSEAWSTFFTVDGGELKNYGAAHYAIQRIAELSTALGFPFSSYVTPPSNLVVSGWDRKNGVTVEKGLDFSDCTDISIYSLFCCMLYDPSVGEYQLDTLRKREYEPSPDLEDFFKNACPKPVENTNLELHREWTKVVQDLELTSRDLDETKEAGKDIIVYVKNKGSVRAEIVTGLLNMMAVLAKVSGFPRERRVRLGEIMDMVQEDDEEKWNKARNEVEAYVAEILKEMSIMDAEVACNGFDRHEGKNKKKDVYGTIEMTYRPSVGSRSEESHTVRLNLRPGHGELVFVPKKVGLSAGAREAMEAHKKACEGDGGPLGRMGAEAVQRFLDKSDSVPIPHEIVKRIESAKNDIERYKGISELLTKREIVSVGEKLYTLDLFVPFLERRSEEIGLLRAGDRLRVACDPVLDLISNIIGSVPLGDAATRKMFLELLRFCHGVHEELFPRIHTSEGQLSGPRWWGFYGFPISTMCEYDVPNMLLRHCREFRSTNRDEYFDGIATSRYGKILATYMRNRHEDGMKAAMEDFRSAWTPGSERSYDMLMVWASVSSRESSYEGMEFVHNYWKTPDKYKWDFSRRFYAYYGPYPWTPLSSVLRDSLCSDEVCAAGLLRIYAWFSMTAGDFDALHDLIVEHYNKIGVVEVLECLRGEWPSFKDISEWGEWVNDRNTLVERAKAYLAEVERLMNQMESFFKGEGRLDGSARVEFKGIRKCIEESGRAVNEYASSMPR